MNNSPCYKCEERSAGCHDTCAKYVDWKVKNNAKNAKERANHMNFVEYKIDRNVYLAKAHRIKRKVGIK